jgi:hypothetical protein
MVVQPKMKNRTFSFAPGRRKKKVRFFLLRDCKPAKGDIYLLGQEREKKRRQRASVG